MIENRNVNIIRAIHSDINLVTLKIDPLIAQGYDLRRWEHRNGSLKYDR